jgi:hypothetical protein
MCDYCNKGYELWDGETMLGAIIKGDKLHLEYDAYSCDSSFKEEITLKYCPECGEKLQVEKPT